MSETPLELWLRLTDAAANAGEPPPSLRDACRAYAEALGFKDVEKRNIFIDGLELGVLAGIKGLLKRTE